MKLRFERNNFDARIAEKNLELLRQVRERERERERKMGKLITQPPQTPRLHSARSFASASGTTWG